MTREEILERLIASQISGEEANRILYNAFLVISWIELIALENNPDFYLEIKLLFDEFRNNNPEARASLVLTDLLAKDGIREAKSSVKIQVKAKRDNVIPFPPWGIKMK